MRLHFSATTEAALLLAGIAVLYAAAAPSPVRQKAPLPAHPASVRAVLDCQEHVTMVHDVHWAAACMANQGDTSAECTLPDERAAALNLAREAADARCVRDMTAGRVGQRAN